jgi:hypothetical protein
MLLVVLYIMLRRSLLDPLCVAFIIFRTIALVATNFY